jgi:predicted DsbA family dithiol-disulfide isomerase
MRVEFFHDVLCAWCYCISPRLRYIIDNKYPSVEVVHRCFALAPTPHAIVEIFGSKEAGKKEILNHWRAANLNNDAHRIDADLMDTRDFDYPYSMPGLIACKAAEHQGGQKAHWDMFDRVQRAHLTECRNIADWNVLRDCAREVGLDMDRFDRDVNNPSMAQAVELDIELATELGVYAVPTIIIDRRWVVEGAVDRFTLEIVFEQLVELGDILTPLPSVRQLRPTINRLA